MNLDRAYLRGARSGPGLRRLQAEVARVMQVLGRDAEFVEPPALLPADMLLDLYGEDIRARAFVTRDDTGERMLRPDFTVPIVQMHMAQGAQPAAYAYCGPVWRRQEAGSNRPVEYLQAGVEFFDGGDPAEADVEAFTRIAEALAGAEVSVSTGDMGLVLAAIGALETTEVRKRALRRHVWRPHAFHRLLLRFGAEHAQATAARAELLADWRAGVLAERMITAGMAVGLRSAEEVGARVERLAEEAACPPLSAEQVRGVEAVLAVKGTAAEALESYRALAREMPALEPAVAGFARRLEVLGRRGYPAGDLGFEASFGRTSLEYYDGFVFGFLAPSRPDLPPLASGGRYDALTRILGGGEGVPAVGGIVRPEALLALREGAA
jgi:ATP phosphoribosyltransferase regulatory subunit